MGTRKKYKKSAEGDFYVEMCREHETNGGCCTAGGAPHILAPEFCSYDEFGSKRYCYVRAQPKTNHEIYKMLRAAYGNEFHCLRYDGQNVDVLQRLVDLGIAQDVSDTRTPEGATHKLRNHCTVNKNVNVSLSMRDIADSLRHFLYNKYEWRIEHTKVSELKTDEQGGISFSYSWTVPLLTSKFDSIYHMITILPWSTPFSDMLITHSKIEQPGSIAVSFLVDDYVRESGKFHNIRWYDINEWQGGAPNYWRNTPY